MQTFSDLDTPLISFSQENIALTIKDSFNNILITGGVGSSKSTGSAAKVISAMMQQQYGMLLTTAKREDKDFYLKLAKQANREHDVIVVDTHNQNTFNFLSYFAKLKDSVSYATNVYQILKSAIQSSETQSAGQEHDAFFQQSMDQLLLSVIDLCLLSSGTLSIERMFDISQSLPKQEDYVEPKRQVKESAYSQAVNDAKQNVRHLVDLWRLKQDTKMLESLSDSAFEELLKKEIPEYRSMKMLHQFFMETMFAISSKTKSIIQLCITNFLGDLLREPVYSLFCKETSFTPEDCIDKGAIVILNLPFMEYAEAGMKAQTLIKVCFQKAWQKRNIVENPRPVAIICDEAHYVIAPTDFMFQSTSRGNNISCVAITQNLSNFYAYMGGVGADHKVKSLLGLYGVKIFHANSHWETNEFVSSLGGESYVEDVTRTVQYNHDFNLSNATGYRWEKNIRPEWLLTLKSGGQQNNFLAECYLFIQGKKFFDGKHFKKVLFKQNI